MSEKLNGHSEIIGNKELHLETIEQNNSLKTHENDRQVKESEQNNSLLEARRTIEHLALPSEKSGSEAKKDNQKTTEHYITKKIKDEHYRQTLRRIQTHLTPKQKRFSSIIHNPKVEKISEIGAKTIARPSGLLGGGAISLIGSLVVIVIAKTIGFSVPNSIFAALFVVGFLAGLLVELILKSYPRKRKL